ncbi:histidinol-phosphate aminotransferase 1 [Marinobacterium zhoushanense]|uniref:Histidinol-phosphate aminotransferase n=1 Tax=Marinobacterium zhoushanense TaxID=1679163 RepID=A0ABQ1K6E8_9GAMM|nr:histidinol-phosphate transaminase [Marinobacterium zhoushanense]GGB89756.1 histidinol-phosphate aminotransferase 1 [Marinobacterium zhoushanense]
MNRFWSPAIQSLEPYTPGEQPRIEGLTKLNTNENPYPPSPAVTDALKHFSTERLRLYPDPNASRLKDALALEFDLTQEQVFVGNGSDEVLALAFMAFFRQPRPLLMPEISYSFYDVYANLFDIDFRKLPLDDQFRIRLSDYPVDNGGIIFANPNAPTGIAVGLEEIEALLKRNTDSLVLVDEAYIDFGGESAKALIASYPNLLVVQTFSKSRSLAGLRIGFAFGHPELIDALERVKNSFNSYPLDMLAIEAACASLTDRQYFTRTCEQIIETRDRSAKRLEELGFSVLPSSTNFIFARHRQLGGAELMSYLRERKILVRHFNKPAIADFLRISIGTDEEMKRLVSALETHPDISHTT